jgi:uncharacterized sporulation protein YeaH/YhbH (DUF444 family)
MAYLIDRRPNAKNKSAVNRQRFLRRYKKQIKEAISEQISKRSITDIEGGESVSIPKRDISEPTFRNDKGGMREGVYPGNKEFAEGDRIKRPPSGPGGQGRRASDQGEGEDEFAFEISRDEYLELLFDDLELPNLKKNQLRKMTKSKTVRAGFTNDGVPTNISVVRTLRGALARRIAMGAEPRRRLRELEAELEALEAETIVDELKHIKLRQEIEELRQRLERIPFIDTFDLRYNNYVQRPEPTSQAVMFCLMDVSGSMDQQTKDIAKRFYILLYLFLSRSYRNVDVVFVRHHTQAKEVDEEEFFYSRETGGTIVSSALELTRDIIQQRYPPTDWNIYAAQASDGDNWNDDSPICERLLREELLPQMRYYAYVEITRRDHQGLWEHYEHLLEAHDNFAMQHIREHEDIYPVFREFFRKQTQ